MKPPYQITNKILKLVASISEQIGEIKSANLSKPPTELRKLNRIRTIHSSLEIEGNTLTVEQITSILEKKRVIGPSKDILEVKNAIKAYDTLNNLDPYSFDSLCEAHRILMTDLVDSAGRLRDKAVGIAKGNEIAHIAPPSDLVKPLLLDLFDYLENGEDLLIIRSCVFHYEFEFIHPFIDGNGRMGRLWQTLILKNEYPVFEFLPVESIVKERQEKYYEALATSDNTGQSTAFVEFMLEVIKEALEELLNSQNVTLTTSDRLSVFKDEIKQELFSRKTYLKRFKTISSATASRDLKYAVDNSIVQKIGEKNRTQYQFK